MLSSTDQVRQVRRFGQISVKVRSVRLLKSGAKSEIGQLDVTPGVQQQVVGFNISAKTIFEI